MAAFRTAALRRSGDWPPTSPCGKCRWSCAGDASESDLTPLARDDFDALAANANLRWIGPADDISLAGVAIRGQTFVVVAGAAVLVILLAEMAVLAWPRSASEAARTRATGPEPMIRCHWLAPGHRQRHGDRRDRRVARCAVGRRTGRSGSSSERPRSIALSLVFYLRFQAEGSGRPAAVARRLPRPAAGPAPDHARRSRCCG